MQEKVHISENRSRVTFFENENKKRVLAISTHFKTTKIAVEDEYFKKRFYGKAIHWEIGHRAFC